MASPDSPILSPERKEHFDELVDQGLWGQISAELADLPAADVAELLSHYGEDSLARLFECLPAEIKPDVLAELPADLAAGLAAAMPAADAADIVNEMAPDDAADVLPTTPPTSSASSTTRRSPPRSSRGWTTRTRTTSRA